jgi:hypothetical protein
MKPIDFIVVGAMMAGLMTAFHLFHVALAFHRWPFNF